MRREVIMGLGMMIAIGASASPLTPEQAISRARQGKCARVSAMRTDAKPVYTAQTADGTPTVYVFNNANGAGYSVLAADDAAYAVLGYSDTGSIDADNMSPELKWWLGEIGRQVAYASSHTDVTLPAMPKVQQKLEAIQPLVTTKWNQDAPYNNDAPMMNNQRCYTGCVATSMAQLMNYHKYPEVGQGERSYYWSKADNKQLTMDFSLQKFDWGNMLDVYSRNQYNDAQASAVAYLMKACGYSVSMNYGTDASGARGSIISQSLIDYFKYDGNTRCEWRVVYSQSQWTKMVWDNLHDVGPVIFNGHPVNDGGHSFICDGYDGNGYFHFNWGWGGMSDGYYLLECMDPEAQGIGGSSGGGFNYSLNGVFGAQKPTGKPVTPQPDNILMYGAAKATLNGNSLQFSTTPWYPSGWWCASSHAIQVNLGAIIEPVDGTPGETVTRGGTISGNVRINLAPGYGINAQGPLVALPANLADGKYKVTVAVRDMNNQALGYYPVLNPYGMPNYVYLNVKDGVKTVENVTPPELVPESLTLDTELYYGRMAKYTAKIKNASDFELTQSLSPALVQGDDVIMIAYAAPTTVDPKTDADITWTATMAATQGHSAPSAATEYELAIVDPVTNTILGRYGKVTVNPRPKQYAMLVPLKYVVDDSELTSGEFDKIGKVSYYPVKDKFNVTLAVRVSRAFFDGTISLGIYKPNAEDVRNPIPVEPGVYQIQPFLPEYEEKEFNIAINFPNFVQGELYMLRAMYTTGQMQANLGDRYFVITEAGGIEWIGDDNDASGVKIYNLQGIEVKNPKKGDIVIVRSGSRSSIVRY